MAADCGRAETELSQTSACHSPSAKKRIRPGHLPSILPDNEQLPALLKYRLLPSPLSPLLLLLPLHQLPHPVPDVLPRPQLALPAGPHVPVRLLPAARRLRARPCPARPRPV